MTTPPPSLFLRLNNLQALPAVSLPPEYSIRSFLPGDESAWEQIIDESFASHFAFDTFMAGDAHYLPERIWFVCHHAQPVATASAWYRDEFGIETGYVHMVGNMSSHAGLGLGLQVSLAALHQMVREQRSQAVLHTDDFRLPAIKTYLKLGFVPEMNHESHPDRWTAIAEHIPRIREIVTTIRTD